MEAIKKLIREAAEEARKEVERVPEPQFVGEAKFPMQLTIGKGLEGAITNATQIGYICGEKGWLIYRGYDIFDLAEKSCFEEVCYLLLFGDLPKKKELEEFKSKLRGYRTVPDVVIDVLKNMPIRTVHPMTALRTAVSMLGALDAMAEDDSLEAKTEIAIKLIAQLPTIAGAISRLRLDKEIVPPDPSMSHAANFYYMLTGEKPDADFEKIMDVCLILHADHGMNASTFTGMVIGSTLSDMYSAVTGAIGSLKGPLHGGANERVIYMLEEIGHPDRVEEWLEETLKAKRKVMGFGHRVYKAYDPRARILKPLAKYLAEKVPDMMNLYSIAEKLDKLVCEKLGKTKRVFPNVDFYSGLVYRSMGIKTKMFTPIFAVSRVAGWTARILEYLKDNRIFRPRAIYTGPLKREYIEIERR